MLGVIIIVLSCKSDLKKVERVASEKEARTEKAQNVEIKYNEEGQLKVKVLAPTLLRYVTEDPYLEMPDGVRVLFYDAQMNVKSRLKADYGINHQDEGKMLVRDNVRVINRKGEKLNAEELIWNEKKEKITSDKFVKITTEDEIIYGDGLVANQDFTNYKIKNIKGTIKMGEKENDTIHQETTTAPTL